MLTFRGRLSILLAALALIGSMPMASAVARGLQLAAVNPAAARVWFLRPSGSNSAAYGASPMIYANGTPIGQIPENSSFYRDLPPGTYRFTVQPYGSPNHVGDTVQLAPGNQTYLEVQWVPTWEEGYSTGGQHSFFVLNMSPQIAQEWLASLTYLGQR